jgi:lytic murein transglycosylase
MKSFGAVFVALMFWLAGGTPVLAAACEPPGGFAAWLDTFKREASSAGVSQKTIAGSFVGIDYDPKIIGYDRNQKVFTQTFEEFSTRMISLNRLQKGGMLMLANGSLLSRIEEQFGVPGAVLVAIWGLETDFGVNIGKIPTIRALSTLAFDCRRTDLFQGELLAALQIIDRGDLVPSEMRGAWAGELGQTQFLPTSYLRFGVDFDHDGRRNLLRSTPDVLASTANFLKGYGWKTGQPWAQGEANFDVLLSWNKSQVYTKTVAAFAQRLNDGK